MNIGIGQLLWKFALAPVDKAANNILKQNLSTSKTNEHNLLDEKSVVDRHRCHMAAKFGVFVDEDHSKLPKLYWLPKLHK